MKNKKQQISNFVKQYLAPNFDIETCEGRIAAQELTDTGFEDLTYGMPKKAIPFYESNEVAIRVELERQALAYCEANGLQPC